MTKYQRESTFEKVERTEYSGVPVVYSVRFYVEMNVYGGNEVVYTYVSEPEYKVLEVEEEIENESEFIQEFLDQLPDAEFEGNERDYRVVC